MSASSALSKNASIFVTTRRVLVAAFVTSEHSTKNSAMDGGNLFFLQTRLIAEANISGETWSSETSNNATST